MQFRRRGVLVLLCSTYAFLAIGNGFTMAQPATPTAAITRTYRIAPSQQNRFIRDMQARFGAALRMNPDAEQGTVAVEAEPQIQTEIANLLGSNDERFVALTPDQWTTIRAKLQGIFQDRWIPRVAEEREIYEVVTRSRSQRLTLEIDARRRGVAIDGSPAAVEQMTILVQSLAESGSQLSGDDAVRTQVLRLQRENHRSLRALVRPVAPAGPHPAVKIPTAVPDDAESGGRPDRGSRWSANPPGSVRPVAFQPPGSDTGIASGDVDATAQEDDAADGDAAPTGIAQFEGVQIESLPDLDVIILRGRDRELDQLADIIEQLERISRDTRPTIRVVPLRHAQSSAVSTLIEQTREDLVGTRQGRVTVTPLVKPNAILLIGWGDAVNAIVELIEALDVPVDAETQSAVFRLQYANASAVQQTLTTFFASREGLAPRIETSIDARTNSLVVRAAPRDLQEVARLIRELDQPDSEAVNQARVFKINHALAADIAQTLQQAIRAGAAGTDPSAVMELRALDDEGRRIVRSGTLERVQITTNTRNNTLIVSSPSENLELIAELIRQLDVPVDQARIKVFRIENGDAASLLQTLRSLVPSQTTAGGGPQLSTTPGESSLTPLRFSVDVRSNSIIATGSEGDLRVVEALLLKLDQITSTQLRTSVYQLRNSPAVDVAASVNQFLVNRRRIEQAVPGTDNPFLEIEREVVVVPEPVANKLILAATPRYFEEISGLIEKLDEQPPQVMIQVLIAEVTLNDADEFGVELGLQDSVLFDRSLLGDLLTTTNTTQESTPAGIVTTTQEIIQAATNLPGFDFNNSLPLGNSGSNKALTTADQVGSQGISNFAVGRGNDALGFGGLVLSASSQNVSVLLRALQESRRVEVLSRPQIRTLDNQPAFIQVGQRVPRIVGSVVNQNGQSNSVALENVGLILGVTPRISPDGTVVMEIDAEKSNLGTEQDGIPVAVSIDGTVIRSPRVDTTTAQATVSAADGETIILGGLITESEQQLHRQVPFLGDLPLLRHLFSYDSMLAKRTELLIILTPQVIRNSADSERIRQMEMARMSWCAADICRIHGDVDAGSYLNTEWLDSVPTEVIYPDANPDGGSILEASPVGELPRPVTEALPNPPLPPEPRTTENGARAR